VRSSGYRLRPGFRTLFDVLGLPHEITPPGKPSAGIEVMQIINREIFRSVIMVFLWGMLVLTVALGGYACVNVPGLASSLLAGGGAFYLVGVLFVTFLFTVPMNNRLDTMDHRSSAVAAYRGNTCVPYWTSWNYVRAISSLGSTVCFLVACIWLAQQSIPV